MDDSVERGLLGDSPTDLTLICVIFLVLFSHGYKRIGKYAISGKYAIEYLLGQEVYKHVFVLGSETIMGDLK